MDINQIITVVLIVGIIGLNIYNYNTYKNLSNIKGINLNEEVYHIYNNIHTYNDAKEKCKLYGGRLATEDEVNDAWKNGANWCNYGWTEGQKALFPAQKDAVDFENRKISVINDKGCTLNYNNKCQKVGVNGGFFPNKNIKFGVNCYGYKPDASKNDLKHKKNDDLMRLKEERKYNKNYKISKLEKEKKIKKLKVKKLKQKENILLTLKDDIILDHNVVNNQWKSN